MGRKIEDIQARKEVNDKLDVEIKSLSAYINDNDDVYVTGGIWAKEGYCYRENTELIIKGDLINKDGCILHTVRSWYENITLDPMGYDSFELCVMNVSRFTIVDDIVGVRVYAVLKRK